MAIAKQRRATDVRSALAEGIVRLRDANVPSHALAAELLLMHALGRDRAWIYSHPESSLDPRAAEKYFSLIARRAAGEPAQYIVGKQEFWGLEFEVNPAVLIPRPETEHVVEVALRRLPLRKRQVDFRFRAAARTIRIIDVGTGSGCIAVALAKELPNAEIVATDLSTSALEVAQRNARRHRVADRIEFVAADLLTLFRQSRETRRPPSLTSRDLGIAGPESAPFHLIVSNPPYVARDEAGMLTPEVREHEPHAALFGGPVGTEVYGRLIEQAGALLVPGGILVLELGHDSRAQVRAMLESDGHWTAIEVTDDLAGIPRVLAAAKR
jgi:release factor glutamine methyltransferase